MKGVWRGWLPNERGLCRDLQVSRSTLRFALEQLHRAGLTRPEHGVGHRILTQTVEASRVVSRTVGVLAPVPLAQLRPSIGLWIDALKDMLHAAGCELRFHNVRSVYHDEPARALQRLCRDHTHAGWILVLSTEAMQHWFMQKGIACVIAGSAHPGVELPSVDLDYRAIARHAAGVLLRAGHRKIAFLNRRIRGAGEIESETGFLEAVTRSHYSDVDATVVYYEETVESVVSAVRRVLEQTMRPTGLLVANSNFYLATVTELARRGIRVPQEISVISRDDDPFLNFVVPQPARYFNDPHLFATKLRTLALHLVEQGIAPVRRVRIEPRFELGGSVARPSTHVKER